MWNFWEPIATSCPKQYSDSFQWSELVFTNITVSSNRQISIILTTNKNNYAPLHSKIHSYIKQILQALPHTILIWYMQKWTSGRSKRSTQGVKVLDLWNGACQSQLAAHKDSCSPSIEVTPQCLHFPVLIPFVSISLKWNENGRDKFTLHPQGICTPYFPSFACGMLRVQQRALRPLVMSDLQAGRS